MFQDIFLYIRWFLDLAVKEFNYAIVDPDKIQKGRLWYQSYKFVSIV